MTWLSFARARSVPPSLFALAAIAACQMPNPGFDGLADDEAETGRDPDDDDPTEGSSAGDGDGDTSTTGDGDGDGDGDPSTTGDGDGDTNTCSPNLELCGDTCTDLGKDLNNCGDCGNLCVGGAICGLGVCVPKRYVFVTSTTHPGNFGGIEAANAICNQRAAQAQLPGSYQAWLSDDQLTPAATFEGGAAAFVLRNGSVLAYSLEDFMDGALYVPINRDEFGQEIEPSPWSGIGCGVDSGVWTGTTDNGEFLDPVCLGWDVASAEVFGTIGDTNAVEQWSDGQCPAPCNLAFPFYCVQQ
jgi:hypothetical protein